MEDVGVYNVAYTAFGILASFASSIGGALFPYYGKLYGDNSHGTISLGVKYASKYTILLISPLTLGLTVKFKLLLTLFAGLSYTDAWIILSILLIFG
ncbi:MAG: hypothetical protein ACTSVW_06560 [Candidatus Njordarchaeales archaeon]